MTNAILRAVDANGNESFYTGRAGAAWVSADRAQAFVYANLARARRIAMTFNVREPLTGLRFVAVAPECPHCTLAALA
jgi:hypothetical protein